MIYDFKKNCGLIKTLINPHYITMISAICFLNNTTFAGDLDSCFLGNEENNPTQNTEVISVGISGTYYYTINNGTVIGLGGRVNYYLNQNSALSGIIRRGNSAPVFGASEPREEWKDDINSLTEITFLYRYGLPGDLNGFFIGSGLSYILDRREDSTKYSYFSFPIVIGNEFRLYQCLYLNIEVDSNISNKIVFWGFDLDILYKL